MSNLTARTPDPSSAQLPALPVAAAEFNSARRKLPLVEVIVRDLVGTRQRLAALTAERDTLDSFRRELTWVSRSRRYTVTEEVAQAEETMTTALNELTELGVSLVDPELGAVEFPTKIAGRPAAFSWRLGEDSLRFWRFASEPTRRAIPAEWQTGAPAQIRNQP